MLKYAPIIVFVLVELLLFESLEIRSLFCSQAQCMTDILFVCGGLLLTSHSLSGHQVDLP